MPIKKIAVMCGSRWYRLSDWKLYGFFWKKSSIRGFGIGPILFWDGK